MRAAGEGLTVNGQKSPLSGMPVSYCADKNFRRGIPQFPRLELQSASEEQPP